MIPSSVQIAGIRIEILREAMDDCGEWRCMSQQIAINSALPADLAGQTYMHELIEAANEIAEIGLRHRQIECLAALLHQSMQR